MYDKCWKHYEMPEFSYGLKNANSLHNKPLTSALSSHPTGSVWTRRKPRQLENGGHQKMLKMFKRFWDLLIFTADSSRDFPPSPAPSPPLQKRTNHSSGQHKQNRHFKPL